MSDPPGELPGRTARERTEDVIRSFIAQYRYLHEWRIQKLIFYADLLSLTRRGYRLTSAQFKRHHYGVYSDDVHDALERMTDLNRTADQTPTGRATVRYSVSGSIDVKTLSREDYSLIQEAHEATRSLTNEKLADWGKETTIWRNTTQGELLDFDSYSKVVGRESPQEVARYARIRAETQARAARFASSAELRREIEDPKQDIAKRRR